MQTVDVAADCYNLDLPLVLESLRFRIGSGSLSRRLFLSQIKL